MALTTEEKNLLLICMNKRSQLVVDAMTDEEKAQGIDKVSLFIALRGFDDARVRTILRNFKDAMLLSLTNSKAAIASNLADETAKAAELTALYDAEIAEYEGFVIL